MEGDFYSPDEPDDVKSTPSMASGLLLSRVTSAPEPSRRVADGPFLPSLHQTPRKRDFPMEQSHRRRGADRPSPPARYFWSPGSSSPRTELEEPPDKRPRLDYIPEKSETGEESSKRRMNPQGLHIHIHERVGMGTSIGDND
ncbi:uncharacterized protein Z520_08093 [Fonsecaea multimorphosa CBS 102226]|uniref:Uncharacterized protein n=1 Tax=Fonsecaea multimorphosa CBS 102226 TaxID=1442371 RepID=A0A0D2H398_9EURO|nr:uncharacterized protein Z520_08093 [Fonsecaea multimorphosa CBS 102226]KIX96315.1 hypothetical protein Z520_08093 [Fonsecaea multimorphosa CBS 102226]